MPRKTVYERAFAQAYDTKLPYPGFDPKMHKAQRDAMKEACHADELRLREVFHNDLITEHDLANHPKEPTLWRIAWEEGHSAGLTEVANYHGALAELLKP